MATRVEPTKLPIVQYWHGEKAPEDVAALMATFPEHNPDLRHLVFSEAGAERFIAERFGARELAAFRACAVPAMQADYFRYCALLALGGVYADVDMRCVAPLSSLLEIAGEGILFGLPELPPMFRTPLYEWRERIGPYRAVNNNIFAFGSPGHPLLELALAVATANIENRVADDVALTTGPGIFTNIYLLRETGSLQAYADFVKGGALESSASIFRDAVAGKQGIEDRVGAIRILPMSETGRWVRSPETRPTYKDTGSHWVNVKGGIFR